MDALLRDLRSPALRSRVSEVTAEALRLSAWASAALEGRPGAAETYVAPVADELGANALRLATALSSLALTWDAAPSQALARMHVLAAGGLVDADRLGQPAGAEQAARLAALLELTRRPTRAPAVVVAATVHGDLLATEAFGPGSGLVARAASRCVLVARGLDPTAVTAPELGHLEQGAEAYVTALEAYRSGEPEGVATWVVHCAQSVALGAREGRRIAASLGPST